MIKNISFENYKAFKNLQLLEVRPITILIGKNSSGKSSIAKLFPLLSNSFSGTIKEPLQYANSGVELGSEFVDLVYNKQPIGPIFLQIEFSNGLIISVKIIQDKENYRLTIFEWGYSFNGFTLVLNYSPDDGYKDVDGNKYDCEFSGFIPVRLLRSDGIDLLKEIDFSFRIDVDYIGPFRILPDRQFHLTGQIEYDKIGIRGQNAYKLLGISKKLKTDLHVNVGDWYKDNFEGWELKVSDSNRPYIELFLCKETTEINIVDVGQGMNQVLPLIVRANIYDQDSIVVLEQPELHLHPAAHGDVMELFAKSAIHGKQSFVIETHSENMILRLRSLIVENKYGLSFSDVVIYSVESSTDGLSELQKIEIDSKGVLSDWPEDVFSENIAEILKIKNALRKKTLK